MTLSITLGWWLAPALFTIAVFAWAVIKCNSYGTHAGSFTPSGAAIAGMLLLPSAAFVSTLAWLLWALVS